MHTNVAEVSQEYLCDAKILRDRPRKSLSAAESVMPRRHPKDVLHAFLKLPFSPSQVLGIVALISGVCMLRSTANKIAF